MSKKEIFWKKTKAMKMCKELGDHRNIDRYKIPKAQEMEN